MKFIGIDIYKQLNREPKAGDIVIVDYTRKGSVPDDFLDHGHGRSKYVCETVGPDSGGLIHLKVLYDLDRNTPYLGKNKNLYMHVAIYAGGPHVETGSGAPALSAGWITREYIKQLTDKYKKEASSREV